MKRTDDREQADLSVVFVTYNSGDVLAEALDSVERHLPSAEIVVVDNGSADETVGIAQARERVRLIEGHGNVGFGAGVNIGADAAAGRLLLVLNPDAVIVATNGPELHRIQAAENVGIRSCQIQVGERLRTGLETFWGWRAELLWAVLQWLIIPRELAAHRPRWPLAAGRSWAGGAAFLVDRAEFQADNGFDEAFFLYFEDQDLSRRYGNRGLPIIATRAVTVTHSGQHSSPDGGEGIQAFALASLVELTARRQGPAASRTAARSVDRALRFVALLGTAVARVPLVGERGLRKARSAAKIRANIVQIVQDPPRSDAYPQARRALRPALTAHSDSTSIDDFR